MAFANLFTRLSAVEEDVKSPVQPVFAHRNNTGNCKRGKARKRKAQGEQTRPYEKKQCYINQTTRTYDAQSFKDDDSKSKHHIQNTYREHSSVGFNKDVIHNHSGKAGHHNVSHKGQNNKSIHNHNLNKQQGWKKEWQSNQHQQKDRGRPAYRGGRHTSRKGGDYRKNRNDKQNSEVKFTRSMTQEFKDQNALLVDGRLICRYFFRGKCIKGDECQLEHVQGYNDLVKEACKFYIQGTCTKGESCPYMHNILWLKGDNLKLLSRLKLIAFC
uniref:zinc finger CCCH domain-containing protein 8-like n=1 Tax=Semicossyphus pulcher TaxID=241346 RepID=UPI0037E8BD7E